jgi:hypothetical protein
MKRTRLMDNPICFLAKIDASEKIYCFECEEIIWECDDFYFGLSRFSSLWRWAESMPELLKIIKREHTHIKDTFLPLGLE